MRPNRALNLAPASSGREDWKLIVGVGGLAVGIFIWKRRSDAASSSSGPELKIVRRAPLQHHGELLVVEVGGQRMLLGATSNSVQHLATLEGADESAVEHAISSVPAVALATPPSTVAPPEPARDESAARFEAMLAAARSVPERDTLRTPPRRPTLPREAPPSEDEVEEQVRGLVSLGVPR